MPRRVGLRGVGAIPGRVCADVCAGGDGTVAMEGEDMTPLMIAIVCSIVFIGTMLFVMFDR